MPSIERDEEREERISNEAIIDAYGIEEEMAGWQCYLEDNIAFPFQAKYVQEMRRSPLKLHEKVTMIAVILDDDSYEILAEIEWMGRTMDVPLHQLIPVTVDDETRQTIEDWHYWDEQDLSAVEDQTQEVEMTFAVERRAHYIAIDPDLLMNLRQTAEARGLSTESLVNLWSQERFLVQPG